MAETILEELVSGVLTVRFNRPDKKNALTPAMYAVMADAIERAEQENEVRVVLFTGTGGVFTAGNDMSDFLTNQANDPDRPVNRFIRNMSLTDVPLLAAVDGLAIGIGTTMLLHFDQVFATERSRFSLPFINLGVVPEAGSSQQLVRACGYQKAAELLMLGEPFDAVMARDCGIVSRLCPEHELMPVALDFAHRLAGKPLQALRATKRLMRRPDEPLRDRVEAEGELFFQCLRSPAAQEIISAFVEKRMPDTSKFD